MSLHSSSQSAKQPSESAAQTSNHRPVVLVVDDEEHLREITATVLQRAGYSLLQAGTAEAALTTVCSDNAKIDVLVTDLHLPRASGAWLNQELRKRNPDMKVIFISGFDRDSVSGDFPPDAIFLQKPFLIGDLMTAVTNLLPSAS